MNAPGLRERKKARTRRLIAETAARLFAERGYEHVAVSDVAAAAEVSEQTVYNYFSTKEQLVTDRDEFVTGQLVTAIRDRAPGTNVASAVRDCVLANVDAIPAIAPELWRGELGYLAVISPTVHRLSLEMTDRQARAIAAAIGESSPVAEEIAHLQAQAIAGVFQLIFGDAGRLTQDGRSQAEIATVLRPRVEAVLDELEAWFALTQASAERRDRGEDRHQRDQTRPPAGSA